MLDPSALVQQHSEAIIVTLEAALRSADPRGKLHAAKLLLGWAWGPSGHLPEDEADPPGGLSLEKQRQAIELLLPHLGPGRKTPNPSATSCPARHEDAPPASPSDTPPANLVINPMSLERAAPAPAAIAPAVSPDSAINPMSREPPPSPLAAPPGTDLPRRDADPMSRALLLASHRAEDAFRRPLPQPPDMEPP